MDEAPAPEGNSLSDATPVHTTHDSGVAKDDTGGDSSTTLRRRKTSLITPPKDFGKQILRKLHSVVTTVLPQTPAPPSLNRARRGAEQGVAADEKEATSPIEVNEGSPDDAGQIQLYDIGSKERGESIVALSLLTFPRLPPPTLANPDPKWETIAVLRLSLSPSPATGGRFSAAFLQMEFTAPAGLQVEEFAPQDFAAQKATVNIEENSSATPKPPRMARTASKSNFEDNLDRESDVPASGPAGSVAASISAGAAELSSLNTWWHKEWSRESSSNVSGILTHNFSVLSYNFGENTTTNSGLERHHAIFFKLNRTGKIEANVYVKANLVEEGSNWFRSERSSGSGKESKSHMTIGKPGKGKEFEFSIPDVIAS